MEFADLPPDVLSLIFQQIDLDDLYSYILLFPTNSTNGIFQVIEAVRYSRLIVTNTWRGLLKLLARAKQIGPVDVLSKYTYVSMEYFQDLVSTLESKFHPEIPVKRSIIYIVCCDYTNSDERYKIMRRFSRLLKTMPPLILNASREVYLSVSPQGRSIERDLDGLVTNALFDRLAISQSIWSSLERLTILGTHPAHEGHDLTSSPVSLDYSNYTSLKCLHLAHLGIEDLSEVHIPPTVTELRLCNNSILILHSSALPPQLKRLDLSYNNFTVLFGQKLPHSLEVLNLRRNLIEEVHSLPHSLRDLDISFNELPSTMFDIPTSLETLRTDIAQYYLMAEDVSNRLHIQQVCIKKNIASHTDDSIFASS